MDVFWLFRMIGAPLIDLVSPVWTIDTINEAALFAALSWWMYATSLRVVALSITRGVGWDAPEYFYRWLWLAPVPWRWPYRLLIHPFNWWRRQVGTRGRPNARFESLAGVCSRYLFRPGDLPIGLLVWRGKRLFQVLGLSGQRGLNLVGAPGSGKSAQFGTILGCLHPKASALYVDPGGDLSTALADHLRATHKFVRIDVGVPDSGQWSLFDEMAACEKRDDLLGVVKMLKAAAEALVPITSEIQPVFEMGARDYVAAVIAYVYLFADEAHKTLAHTRQLICCGMPAEDPTIDPADNLLFEMEDCHKEDGPNALLTALIARGAATMRGSTNPDHGNPFLASARRSTSWIDVDTSSGRSGFLMADLQQGNTVVGIVGSVVAIRGTYQPLVRLMLTMLGHVYTTMPKRKGPPGLAIADEAQNLNQLALVESGPHMRKYKLKVLAGWQDLPGMAAAYPKTWESILASAEANVFFETADKRTLEWISVAMGRTIVRTKIDGSPWFLFPFLPRARRIRATYREETVDLRNPAQVRDALAPGRGRIIVLSANLPFIAAAHPYWRALPLWRYVSPGYPETILRKIGRSIAAMRGSGTPPKLDTA